MKFFYQILILLITTSCLGQNVIIVGELRMGNTNKSFIPFNKKDEAKFCIDDFWNCKNKIEAKTFSKERYYVNKNGTGIEFHIDENQFTKNKTVKIHGALYTYLNKEKIRGVFDLPITIDLNNDCKYVGGNVYRMDYEIPIHAPEKYSLVSMINYLNKKLYSSDSIKPSYFQDVVKILNFDLETEVKVGIDFLSKCFEIYNFIIPHMKSNPYTSTELKGLNIHIADLDMKIEEYINGTTSINESPESIKRDKFESELVLQEYEKLHKNLFILKEKIENISFEKQKSTAIPDNDKNSCEKNIDFRLGSAISFGTNSVLDQFKATQIAGGGIELIENPELNGYSFSVAGMTNFYMKKRFKINPGLALGVGATFQNDEVNLVAYLGGTLALGKSRTIVLNFGLSYLPVEELIPDFTVGDTIFSNDISSEDVFTIKMYTWTPFLSLSVGLPTFTSDKKDSIKNEDLKI